MKIKYDSLHISAIISFNFVCLGIRWILVEQSENTKIKVIFIELLFNVNLKYFLFSIFDFKLTLQQSYANISMVSSSVLSLFSTGRSLLKRKGRLNVYKLIRGLLLHNNYKSAREYTCRGFRICLSFDATSFCTFRGLIVSD